MIQKNYDNLRSAVNQSIFVGNSFSSTNQIGCLQVLEDNKEKIREKEQIFKYSKKLFDQINAYSQDVFEFIRQNKRDLKNLQDVILEKLESVQTGIFSYLNSIEDHKKAKYLKESRMFESSASKMFSSTSPMKDTNFLSGSFSNFMSVYNRQNIHDDIYV